VAHVDPPPPCLVLELVVIARSVPVLHLTSAAGRRAPAERGASWTAAHTIGIPAGTPRPVRWLVANVSAVDGAGTASGNAGGLAGRNSARSEADCGSRGDGYRASSSHHDGPGSLGRSLSGHTGDRWNANQRGASPRVQGAGSPGRPSDERARRHDGKPDQAGQERQ
jgi:hypothetical protein